MIREYEQHDVDQLIKIWRSASLIGHPFLTDEFLDKEENLMRYIYLQECDTWVYETNENITGFISMVGHDVGALFIEPSIQRSGIGRGLLDFVKQFNDYLTVDVFKENKIGCSFYLKYGFVIVTELMHEETGNMLIRMELKISNL